MHRVGRTRLNNPKRRRHTTTSKSTTRSRDSSNSSKGSLCNGLPHSIKAHHRDSVHDHLQSGIMETALLYRRE